MKYFACLFLVGLLGLVSALEANVQEINVTPATLADWQVTGANRDELQTQAILKLPAGSEISRTFSSGTVVLHSVSRPHFGSSTEDWPVVQVGPTALALIRRGVHGELVLLVGEQVSPLPFEVLLDANGNVLQLLEVTLGYNPTAHVGVVAFGDQALSFKATTEGSAVEIAVSAGEKTPWGQESLQVQIIGSDEQADKSKGAGTSNKVKRSALLKSAADILRQAGEAIGGQSGAGVAGKKPQADPIAGGRLEIYTPASVRRGATSVRAAIAQSQGK